MRLSDKAFCMNKAENKMSKILQRYLYLYNRIFLSYNINTTVEMDIYWTLLYCGQQDKQGVHDERYKTDDIGSRYLWHRLL